MTVSPDPPGASGTQYTQPFHPHIPRQGQEQIRIGRMPHFTPHYSPVPEYLVWKTRDLNSPGTLRNNRKRSLHLYNTLHINKMAAQKRYRGRGKNYLPIHT